MEFDDYQREALRTDRVQREGTGKEGRSVMVPMLGLAGETGQLLSEYKKHLRDGEAHRLFGDRVAEELGDLLWYIANVASKFGLSLDAVASGNLVKVKARWSSMPGAALCFDASLPEGERLPRRFEVELRDMDVGSNPSPKFWGQVCAWGAFSPNNPSWAKFCNFVEMAARVRWPQRLCTNISARTCGPMSITSMQS